MIPTAIAGADPDLRKALARAGLPTSDLEEPGRRFFRFGAGVFGGLEGDGPDLLLRSLVVDGDLRGTGRGRDAAQALEEAARALGGMSLHLLTVDAASFFDALGFARADRSAAPEAIARSVQFASLCPGSATYMIKVLA